MDEFKREVATNKKTAKRIPNVDGVRYTLLAFVCPGCVEFGGSGLHLLPVNTSVKKPSWSWDGNLESPTLGPSILTGRNDPAHRCHSFLEQGVFRYLDDCTHSLKGQRVPMVELPQWFLDKE